MVRAFKSSVALLSAAMLAGLSVNAAAQQSMTKGFSYQGVITDSGLPQNGPVNMVVSCWNHPTSSGLGTQVGGNQTLMNVPVIAGRFAVVLNENNEFGLAFTTSQRRWIQVAINGVTLSPRFPIYATPSASSLVLPFSMAHGFEGPAFTFHHVLTPDPNQFSPAIWAVKGIGSGLHQTLGYSPAVLGDSNESHGVVGLSQKSSGVLGYSASGFGVTGTGQGSNGGGVLAVGTKIGLQATTSFNGLGIGVESIVGGFAATAIKGSSVGDSAFGLIVVADATGESKPAIGAEIRALGNASIATILRANGLGAKGLQVELANGADIGATLQGRTHIDADDRNNGTFGQGTLRFGGSTGEAISSNRLTPGQTANRWGLDFWTNSSKRVSITNAGLVGINTQDPKVSLDVVGGVRARGGLPGAFGTNNNGYAFGLPGDDDSGLFSFGDNQVSIVNNGLEAVRVTGGSVGIGVSNPSQRLTVNGNVLANNVVVPSSIRFKEHVRPIEDALGLLAQIRGVRFDWKPEHAEARLGKSSDIGLVAEEVADVFPEVIFRDADGSVGGVDYSRLVSVAIEAIKQARVEHERERAADRAQMAAQIAALERRLLELERSNHR